MLAYLVVQSVEGFEKKLALFPYEIRAKTYIHMRAEITKEPLSNYSIKQIEVPSNMFD